MDEHLPRGVPVSGAVRPSLDAIFEHLPTGAYAFDSELRVIAWNGRLSEIMGISAEEVMGFDLHKLADTLLAETVARVLSGESSTYEGPYYTMKEGRRIHIHVRLVPLRDAEGRVIGGTGIIEDVSQRREAVEAIKSSEARFRSIIEHAPDPVVVLRDGLVLFANWAFALMVGKQGPDACLGTRAVDYLHPDDLSLLDARTRNRHVGEPALPPQVYRVIRSDGETKLIEGVSLMAEYDGAPALICMMRDITERTRMQNQLLQADRLAAVGTLAAGVAHEINNPLACVMASLELMTTMKLPALAALTQARESEPEAKRKVEHTLAEIDRVLSTAREAAERMAGIVRDLKILSREDERPKQSVDLKKIIESTLNIASHEIRHRAHVQRRYHEGVFVEGNEARLGQVFLNLFLNAAQAFETDDVLRNEIVIEIQASTNDSARVIVSDNGPGISALAQRRIFDPFFTTKPHGVGTGLGLSIARGIIADHGGTISLTSEPGRGATFCVELPTARQRDIAIEQRPQQARRKLLIVDDERRFGELLRESLAPVHDVTVAASAAEALRELEQDSQYDLLLCDLMMPDVSGSELYEILCKRWPHLRFKVRFMTGGPVTDRAKAFAVGHSDWLLEKPFRLHEVADRIERWLA